MNNVKFGGYRMPLPGHPVLRRLLGLVLVFFGLLGFLPVLGFWMIPLGLAILGADSPPIRRLYRRTTVALGSWLHRHFPDRAKWFGYGAPRGERKG